MASRRSWLISAGRENSRGLAGALAFAAAIAFASGAQAQPDVSTSPDTVMLTDGGRIRGHVMEDDESGVSVILADGTTKKVPRSKVLRVQYRNTSEAAHVMPPPDSGRPTAPAQGTVSGAPLAAPAPLPALADPGLVPRRRSAPHRALGEWPRCIRRGLSRRYSDHGRHRSNGYTLEVRR